MQSVVIKSGNGNSVMTSFILIFQSIASFKLNSSINIVLNKYFSQIKQLFYYRFDNVVLAFFNLICHWKCISSFHEDTKADEWKIKWM